MSTDIVPENKGKGHNLTGRPKGAVSIHSKKAAKKLADLGFDPIEKMVELHQQLDNDIATLMFDEDGEERTKYSAMALATLQSAKQKVISDLLRYGYARAAESVEVSPKAIAPIQINLTATAVDFDTSRLLAQRVIEMEQSPIDDDAPMKGPDE